MDGDGLPDGWEIKYGLTPTNSLDAATHPPGDQLTYLQKYLYGLNPLTTDTDGDGLSDYEEIFVYHTNPLLADTDGDGIPDKWEVDQGLKPVVNDATQIRPDGVSNLQIYQYNLTHTNQLDPRNPFFAPGTSIYEVINNGQHTNRFYYDREDRLLGAEYSRGISLAYTYDGNGNILRQTYLSRANETNGLPVFWQFLNGLTNNTSAYTDTDGDGWTDYQEWKAGTNPRDAQSTPNLLGNPGTQIASLQLPFTPSNFVAGVGQLDGTGAEEIVIGADGNPGTNTNFLLVLTQSAQGPPSWTTQRVDIGPFGVTSLAIGQPTNRSAPAIYAGLRQTGGSGRIVELLKTGGAWQTNVVANSTNDAAFVLGVRGPDVLVSLATRNAANGALYAVNFTTNWQVFLIDTNTSHRGLGTIVSQGGTLSGGLRLVDIGGIDLRGGILPTNLPANAVYRSVTGKWYFVTPTEMTWSGALAYAQEHGGTLVAIEDLSENDFIKGLGSSSELWVGLYRNSGSNKDNPSSWIWTSGSSSPYRNWLSGSPNGDDELQVVLHTLDGKWDDAAGHLYSRFAVGQVTGDTNTGISLVRLAEPSTISNVLWRGSSLASGFIRGTHGGSIFYTFVDDKGNDGQIGFADDFVTAEYLVVGTNATLLTLSRQPIASTELVQSYGLASVNFLNTGNEVFFTGEPDGQVFAWTSIGTNPLQRQIFTGHHAGRAWHALTGVKTLESGEGLIGLRVDPTNQSRCDVILWSPQSQLPQLASLPNTAPAAAVLPATNTLGSLALVIVRLWDAEGNASTPFMQFQLAGMTNWQNATLTALDGTPYNLPTRVAALPTGVNHTLTWNALSDLGSNVVTNLLLRARAQDLSLLGDWSLPTPFQIDTSSSSTVSTNLIIGPSQLLPDGRFQLTVVGGVSGQSYIILASTNLLDWLPISGYVFTNPPITIFDPDAPNFRWRFYRIGPLTSAPPMTLGLGLAQPLNSNGFNLTLFSLPGLNYQIDASTNLVNWTTITNFISTNSPFYFRDPAATNYNRRFYRAVVRP